jgi:hypothetical protein
MVINGRPEARYFVRVFAPNGDEKQFYAVTQHLAEALVMTACGRK